MFDTAPVKSGQFTGTAAPLIIAQSPFLVKKPLFFALCSYNSVFIRVRFC